MTPADEIMKSVADDMGVGDTFIQTPVGVYFGEPGKKAKDPYFGGVGPERTGCIECGECMTGLPSRSEEHAPQELSGPCRDSRRRDHSDDHRVRAS